MKLYLINNEICQGEDSLEEICALQSLTNEQTEFYNSNPGASVSEVINCQLIVPYVPSLEEAIKFRVDAFSREAFESRERILPEYKIINCALGIYDQTTSSKITDTVNSFRNEFYRLKTLCEACTSIEELNAIQNDYSSITINL